MTGNGMDWGCGLGKLPAICRVNNKKKHTRIPAQPLL